MTHYPSHMAHLLNKICNAQQFNGTVLFNSEPTERQAFREANQ